MLHISAQNSNTGNSLTNPTWWTQVSSPNTVIPPWNPGLTYHVGNVIIGAGGNGTTDHMYVSLLPENTNNPTGSPTFWADVSTGTPIACNLQIRGQNFQATDTGLSVSNTSFDSIGSGFTAAVHNLATDGNPHDTVAKYDHGRVGYISCVIPKPFVCRV